MSTRYSRTKPLLYGLLAGLVLCLAPPSCMPVRPTTADILESGFADLRALADSVITDEVRRETYRNLSLELESDLLAFDEYAAGYGDGYRTAFIDYTVGPEELRERSETFRGHQRTMQDRFVALHLAMAGAVTAEEWQALSPQEAKIIESLLDTTVGKKR